MSGINLDSLKQRQDEIVGTINNEQKGNWQTELVKIKNTNIVRYSYSNIKLIFDNDSNLKDILGYDLFKNIEILTKKTIWKRPISVIGSNNSMPFTDDDEIQIRNYIRANYNMDSDKTKLFSDVIKEKCLENSFNPLTDFLNDCHTQWDKQERIKNVLSKYLGVSDSELMQTAFKTMLVGAVARAFRPSSKFDYMAIFTGSQGIGKSTLLAKLGGQWFTDSLQGYNSKDDVQLTLGFWLIEDAELSAMKSSRIDTVKKFITKLVDSVRLPYGKRVVDYPRRFTLWGTTNQSTFLHDKTGSRRFLVFKCNSSQRTKTVADDMSESEVKQIWGEAVHLYKNNYPLHLSDELEKEMEDARNEYQSVDEVTELVKEYLDIKLPSGWYSLPTYEKRAYIHAKLDNQSTTLEGIDERIKITIKEIMAELLKQDYKDSMSTHFKKTASEVREVMKNLEDWEYKANFKLSGKNTAGFIKKV